MTIQDIIDKRKLRWTERHDLEYDKRIVESAVNKILNDVQLREEIIAKPYLLIECAFLVVDKNKKTIPFFLNDVQADFIKQVERLGTKKPYFILKGRQQGFTSIITAIQLAFAIVRKNFSGFTIADKSDNTRSIFNDKARVVFDRLPEALKPTTKYNSVNELFFDKLNSSWRAATATGQVGRSKTLNFVHFSEVAFYECNLSDLQAGIGEAITADSWQIYETTANGFNQAKELWDNGSCNNLFYEWWKTAEYRTTEYEYLDNMDEWLTERIKLLESKGLDREQLAWYAKKYNSYLDKSLIKQEYPITPEEAFISTGDSVFPTEQVANQIARVGSLKPKKQGYFEYRREIKPIIADNIVVGNENSLTDIKWIDDPNGYITIHEEPRVKKDSEGNIIAKAPYTIGGDTAGSGEDYFTAKVVCNLDGQNYTTATLHKQRIDEDLYAEQVLCLAKYFNDALIGIEINYSRQPIRTIQKYGYTNLYMRERVDKATDETQFIAGFQTTAQTKPIIIAELVRAIRENPSIEVDIATLKEMLVFVRKDGNKMEAVEGCHDDLVMALAIAHFVSRQQDIRWQEVQPEEDNFLRDNFNIPEQDDNNGYMSWEDM